MKEPHASLSAFLSDLQEQCKIFKTQSPHNFTNEIVTKIEQTLVSAGFVVAVDARRKREPGR